VDTNDAKLYHGIIVAKRQKIGAAIPCPECGKGASLEYSRVSSSSGVNERLWVCEACDTHLTYKELIKVLAEQAGL